MDPILLLKVSLVWLVVLSPLIKAFSSDSSVHFPIGGSPGQGQEEPGNDSTFGMIVNRIVLAFPIFP